MNKLNAQPTPLTLSPASPSTLVPAHWLIVLVPNVEADLIPATRCVWELANAGAKRVRFIGLYENAAQELSLRRQMAGMSAMMGSAGIYTETEALAGSNWIEAVRSRWQAGDLVVCFGEQRVGSMNRSLSHVLQSSLDVPIYILSGRYLPKDVRFNWQAQFFAWSGSIALILGFFLLQVRIDQLTSGWTQPVLVIISVALELWMIWVWNDLFGSQTG